METSPYFPNPAELKALMIRAEILANSETAPVLPQKRAKVTAIPDGMTEEDFLDAFIESQIEWEREVFGDDDDLAGFLPYEK